MATFYRKKDHTGKALSNWYCFFRALDRDGNVKQVRRSTRDTTKGRAQKKAQDLGQAFKNDHGSGDATSRDILGRPPRGRRFGTQRPTESSLRRAIPKSHPENLRRCRNVAAFIYKLVR